MAGTKPGNDGFETTEKLYKLKGVLSKTDREALEFASGDTVKSFTVTASGEVIFILVEMPTFSGAVVTGVCSIENSDGVKISSSPTCAENTVTPFSVEPAIPLVGTNTVKITLNTDPLSSGTCYVTMYLKGDY